MSTEIKLFGGRFEPQKGSLKKDPSLPIYVTFTRTKNKSIAKTLLHAEFLKFAPDYADNYFAPKVWEAEVGMFPSSEGQFYTDLFTDEIVWNAEKGEPERVPASTTLTDHTEDFQNTDAAPQIKLVTSLDRPSRTACLVLFGPVTEISNQQYSQIVDLINDDESSFARELAEAIARESRVLELLPERQEELLAHVREMARETAQWTDIKKIIVKWLDTPQAQCEQAKSPSISELQLKVSKLRYYVACGVISRAMDFDINSPPIGIEMRVNTLMNESSTEVNDWLTPFSNTPGVYDFAPASIIAIIKTAEDRLHVYPGEVRKYIDQNIAAFDCINPPQLVIDIACGLSSFPLPKIATEATTNDETKPFVQGEDLPPPVDPMHSAQLDKELNDAFAGNAYLESQTGEQTEPQQDSRAPVDAREIEIAHALNDLLSGRTGIMDQHDVNGVLACTGHLAPYVLPLLIIDIATTEFCLSPNFSDEEIHDVATTILDGWSDEASVRQKIALDAIVEYRRPEPPKTIVINPPVVTVKPKREPEPVLFNDSDELSYRQQLTLAALQGMCANPACRGDFDDLPMMAVALASGVIDAEDAQ